MTPNRQRAKGRRGGEVEHFAKLPVSIMESEAVRTLEHAAFRTLAMVAAGFRGRNNGAMAVTPRFAARFGMTSKDTLYKSLRELVRRGLLIETRQGWRGVKNHFALYAVSWVDIQYREGKPLDVPESCKPYLRRLYEWPESLPLTGNELAESSTSHRGNSIPATGKESPDSVPATGLDPPLSVPATGNTSRYLGGVSPGMNGRQAQTSLSSASTSKMIALILGQPHLSDRDLAGMFDCDHTVVARIRESENNSRCEGGAVHAVKNQADLAAGSLCK